MPFLIANFDGEDLPQWLERSDTQSMGPASASSDFVQLPGGGFYDNYGDFDSPRDLSTVSKQTVIYATDAAGVREQIELWRSKVGKRARLEALWHDDEVRWLWARLVKFTHARPFNARLTHLPCEFAFAPATGVWYGDEQVTEDTTFVSSTMDEEITFTHAGNVNASDPIFRFVSAFDDEVTLTLESEQTSQKIAVHMLAMGVDEEIVIDVGQRTVRIYFEPVDITTISRSGTTITIDCGGAHGLAVDRRVVVEGTDYDGFYVVATVPDADTITVEIDPLIKQPTGPQTPVGATLAWFEHTAFASTTFSDPGDWFTLVPGENTIHLTADVDMDGSTFSVIYWPTYA